MKTVKASEARKHWFRLLDEALRGEVIAVERKGQRIVLRREGLSDNRIARGSSQYKKLLKVPRADEVDRWSWEWRPERGLVSRRRLARWRSFLTPTFWSGSCSARNALPNFRG